MPNSEVLRQLVAELERVGIDADNMVAGLTSRADEALRALRRLPDGAGPQAFLAQFRSESASGSGSPSDNGEANRRALG